VPGYTLAPLRCPGWRLDDPVPERLDDLDY
jgi:hypothetical protein